MKIHLGWLREHVDLPESAEEVGRRLTTLGLALDGIENAGDGAVLDLDVGSNRPDAMSHVGVARELATALGRELRVPRSLPEEGSEDVDSVTSVTIEDADLCPRYTARVVKGVRVGPSPAWMKDRLEACGIRPINVMVDVTNYVLLELGTPLHAFDLSRLAGRRIVVRRSRVGETMATLDGTTRTFEGDELLIADAERGVAVAGIMGGADSEIRDDTRDVLIESAYFDPASIRRTARRLGLHTEASHRFERGADIDAVPRALDRCATLMAQLAGGTVLSGIIDVGGALPPKREVRLRRARVTLLCGLEIPDASIERTLTGLGFEVVAADAEGWIVRAPRARGDVSREVDLIEEVLRHHGYDAVPVTLPPFREGARPRQAWEDGLASLRRVLVASGYQQTVSFSFDDPAAMEQWGSSIVEGGAGRVLSLSNPMAETLGVLRTSLVPGLLRAASTSSRRGETDVRIFEEGRIFLRRDVPGPTPVEERWAFALAAMGRRGPSHFRHQPPPLDILAVKGVVLDALVAAGASREDIHVVAAEIPHCAPGAAAIHVGDRRIGWIGRIHPDVLAPLEIDGAAFAAEADLSDVLPAAAKRRTFAAPSRFPKVIRDLCVLVDGTPSYGAIIAIVQALPMEGDIAPIESVELIDRYVGAGVPAGKVSLTFSVAYRSAERTLTQDEVDRRHAQLFDVLAREFGATLRT
jgi:phenylalanyl-tRNA synthetase beta chain